MSMRYPAGFISAFYNPLQNPNAPTIGTATAEDAQISVTFTAPSNVGGSAITSYIITARRTSNGDLTSASGASSPVVVTGLVNGEAYTATAVAVNSYGPSVSSAASNSVTPAAPSTIGQAYGGGFFGGRINVSGTQFYLIVSPKATGEAAALQWGPQGVTTGINSVINGPTNSASLAALGAGYQAANFCENLNIGGFTDWYMPARNELEVLYYFLKPTTTANNTSSGSNANAVSPEPISTNYSSGSPAQTSAGIGFRTGEANAFASLPYWSSTEGSGSSFNANTQNFDTGLQRNDEGKTDTSKYTRAVRRIPV